MNDYRVELDVYHGPLDLLLHLIKRNELDIHDIPVARITDQYLRYVRTLQELDINLAGEFLVMAATLMEIKSAMIAPHESGEEDETAADALTAAEDPSDPRYELVQQLLTYKRFKDAAAALQQRQQQFAARFPRQPAQSEKEAARQQQGEPELDVEDVSVWDLMEAFQTLMDQVGGPPRVDMVDDETPIELHAADIVDRLQREGEMTLQAMFAGRRSVSGMIGLFSATLELMRQQKVRAVQERREGPILLRLRPQSEWAENQTEQQEPNPQQLRFDPEQPDNFEWPDEETRRRYERRVQRRQRGERIREDEELAEDVAAIEKEEAGGGAEQSK